MGVYSHIIKGTTTCLLLATVCFAQSTFPTNGAPDIRNTSVVFINANIFTDYQTLLKNATLYIEGNKVAEVGKVVNYPKNVQVIDLQGKYIYPGFIDLFTNYGIKANEPVEAKQPQYQSSQRGAYAWNDAIKSYQEADKLFKNDAENAKKWLKNGFTTLLSHQTDGICRGTGVLVCPSEQTEHTNTVVSKAASFYSFNKGSSTQVYPTALTGAIALLRQSFYDRDWHIAQKNKQETHIALQALAEQKNLPFIIHPGDKQSLLRAHTIATEFKKPFIMKTQGDEYQIIPALKKCNNVLGLIVPINFPKPYKLENAFEADIIPYKHLKHWELAPFNAYMLWKEGLHFAFTMADMENPDQFLPHLRKAIQAGLPEKEALKALTYQPAAYLGILSLTGSLQKNKLANFFIASDSLSKEDCIIFETWTLGRRHIQEPMYPNISGIYHLSHSLSSIPDSLTVFISGKHHQWEAEIMYDTVKQSAKVIYTHPMLNLEFTLGHKKCIFSSVYTSTTGWNGIFNANNQKASAYLQFSMNYKPAANDLAAQAEAKQKITDDSLFKGIGSILYPFQAYGNTTLPVAKRVLFKNATVWTNEQAGVLQNTDVLIDKGKIVQIGKINAQADTVIDATGKHLTSGIIDEHSHIAISGGVNECSHSITAEVRMGDVIDNEDINIYRNLAGGVTAAQILHGSCNCIGGQSGIIKLRWGKQGADMQIANADGFIKFALGENVKQSNWGDNFRERFPQTRMGVEQVIEDAFNRAREYEKIKQTQPNYRKDLQLEAILEILNKKRFITCHSYVNSEILMLMQLAERFGIRVNTFTHILEGYKLAEEMRQHGVGASTFSDWWAYKYEVKDAIPYNAALMHQKGVLVAINSDNAEMARRLNQEAAKAIKYGGVSEQEAWKMVTLNPAKMLHLDKFTGSIAVGKDADIVLWSTHPLSVYAKCEATFVDGVCYYDVKTDKLKRVWMSTEKTRILDKMANSVSKGVPFSIPVFTPEEFWHCGTGGEDKDNHTTK